MFATLMTVFGFMKSNVKWIAMLAAVVAVSYGAYKYTKLIRENALARIQITQLKGLVEEQKIDLEFERELSRQTEQLNTEAFDNAQKLQDQLEEITTDLPADIVDPAPKSTLEVLKRLKEGLDQ